MVLSLPQLTDKLSSGSAKWRDLLGSLRAYTHLPWDRKELVDVATYHLKGLCCYYCLYKELCDRLLISDIRAGYSHALYDQYRQLIVIDGSVLNV